MREIPILFSAPMVRGLLSGTKTQTRRVFKQAKGLSLSVGIPDETPGVAELSWLYGDGPGHDVHEEIKRVPCPYGRPGDRLWVRETHAPQADCWGSWERWMKGAGGPGPIIHYAADMANKPFIEKWRPSIHMPRWASRITLDVTGVRVERLQDISEKDAMAEGCERLSDDEPGYVHRDEPDYKLCPQCGGTRLYTAFNPATGGALPDTDCMKCDTYVKRYQHLWESINGPESWSANPWVWCVEFRRLP